MGNLADLEIAVLGDTSDLEGSMASAAQSVESFESSTSRVGTFVEQNFAKIGAAATGIAAGAEVFARSQGDMNSVLERTSIVGGDTTSSLREMVDGMTSWNFSARDATAGMERLMKSGMSTRDELENVLPVFDNFNDATGIGMVAGIDLADGALSSLGIPLSEAGDHMDALTFLMMQTNVEAGEFERLMRKVGPTAADMGMDLDDVVTIMSALDDKGIRGRDAVRVFDQAMNEAGSSDELVSLLGLTNDELAASEANLAGAAGLTDKFAAANNDATTVMEKVQANVENLMFRYGGLAEAASLASAPLAGVGTAMMGVSMVAPGLVSRIGTVVAAIGTKVAAVTTWAATTVAAGGRALAAMAVTSAQFIAHYTRMAVASLAQAARMAASWVIAMGPVAWVIAAIAALVAVVVANWDTIVDATRKAWEWVSDKIAAVWDWITRVTSAAVDAMVRFFTDLRDGAVRIVTNLRDRVVGFFTGLRDSAVSLVTNLRDGAVGAFTGLRDRAVDAAAGLRDRVVEFFGGLRDRVVGIATGVRDRVVGVFTGLKDGAIGQVVALIDRVKAIKDDVIGFFSGAGQWLVEAGKNIMRGLTDGIRKMASAPVDAMSNVAQGIRNRLPFSPAKEGPLSGRGSPDLAGAKLVEMIGDGMGSGLGGLSRQADAAAQAAMPGLGGVRLPSVNGRAVGGDGAQLGSAGGSLHIYLDDRELINRVLDEAGREINVHGWRG